MTIASGERLESAPEPERPAGRVSRAHLVVAALVALAVVAVMLPIGVHGVPPTTSKEPLGTLEWTLVAENVGICVHVTSEGPLEHTDSSTVIGRGLTHYKVEDINTHWTLRWATTSWENGACTTTPAPVSRVSLIGVWSTLAGNAVATLGPDDPSFAGDAQQGSISSGLSLPDVSGWVRRPDTCYIVSTHAIVYPARDVSDTTTGEPQRFCLHTAW